MKYVLNQKEGTEEYQAMMAIRPGMKLYGFCGGLFGRDSYGEKTILEVHEDHVVVTEDGFTMPSRKIDGDPYSWVGLIEDSNRALKEDW